jgi:uncharacterized protein (TIGR00255 family)
MDLRSMTGHGRGEATRGAVRAEVELWSVNRRQLEARLALPRALSALEPRVQEALGRSLKRGCVSGTAKITASGSGRRAARVEMDAARQYLGGLRRVARALGLKDDLSAQSLLAVPELVRCPSPADDPEAAWPALSQALARAVRGLVAMRREEGAALARDIGLRLARLRRLRLRIGALAPRVPARYRKRLLDRLREAGAAAAAGSQELLREVALLADRSDISEELTRLDSHLGQAGGHLGRGGTVGRTLDFLCQEMFREINTAGSKANDAAISRQVVLFKAELERMREQVQNLE